MCFLSESSVSKFIIRGSSSRFNRSLVLREDADDDVFTFRNDGRCFRHKPGRSASRARLPSASPRRSVTNTAAALGVTPPAGLRPRDQRLHVIGLTSAAATPTLSPALKARFRFSACDKRDGSRITQNLNHINLKMIRLKKNKKQNTLCAGFRSWYAIRSGR